MQRLLIASGVLFSLAGLLWPWLSRLPGDGCWVISPSSAMGYSFHFPLVTSLIISVAVSVLLCG